MGSVSAITDRSPAHFDISLYSASDRGARSIVMSVSVCLFVRLSVRDLHEFLCVLLMAVDRSSSGGVVICYVLPVLWMTSYLLISQGCSTSTPSWSAVHTQPWAWQ